MTSYAQIFDADTKKKDFFYPQAVGRDLRVPSSFDTFQDLI